MTSRLSNDVIIIRVLPKKFACKKLRSVRIKQLQEFLKLHIVCWGILF